MLCSLVSSTRAFRRNLLISWLLIFSLLSSAFVPGSVASLISSPVDGHTFILATSTDATTLDPALAYDTASGEVIQNIYETLVFYDGANSNSFVPQLASSYELSGDGLTWTFHIRPNVTFHNGASLTASDVAYSFQRGLLQGGSGSPQWLLTEPFLGVGIYDISLLVDPTGESTDDRAALSAKSTALLVAACEQVQSAIQFDNTAGTVTMHLAQPWAPFLSTISSTWGSIMDKVWAVNHGGWDGSCNTWQNWYAMTSNQDPLTTVTNGTGPFKLDHWYQGQEIALARNSNYWRTPAQLEGVVIQIVPDNNTRFSMLQTGDVYEARPVGNIPLADEMVGEDCVWNINTSQYDCSIVDSAKALKRYTGRPGIAQNHVLLNFDITIPSNPYVGSGQLNGNGIPFDFFSDVHIRKAFNYCFDWDTFNQQVYGGGFVQGTTLVLEGMPGYDLNAPHYTFDLALCETQLGLADLDHDAIPSINDTNDVTQVGFHFQMPYNEGNLLRQKVAEILSASFSQIDPKFVIDPVSLPGGDYFFAQDSGFLPIMTGGWAEDIHDPHNWYQPYLVGTYSNRANISDDLKTQFNALIIQGVSTTDFAERHAIYQQLNQVVYDNAPLIILGGATNYDFTQRGIGGHVHNQAFPGNYYYPIHIDSADINATLGTTIKGNYDVVHFKSQRVAYTGLNNGPAILENLSGFPIIASQRVIFGGVSYSEMMGLPLEQLSKEYWFPYYNNVAMNSQLRVSNVGGSSTLIKIYLGTQQIDSYTLAGGSANRKDYPGKNGGPLRVTSSSTNILATIRVLYAGSSYSEMMGLPVEQLTKEYLFPYYNDIAMNSQLRVSNVGGVNTTINVYLGSNPTPIDSYTLLAGGARRKNYAVNSGPLRVTSSASNILTTIRVLYGGSSYSELMGYPSDQPAQEYWYPVYDNSSLNSQLRVSNVGVGPTTITVYAGTQQIDSYSLAAGGAVRRNYVQNTGPLHVVSSTEPILSTIRMLYTTPGYSSYYEMTGLPDTQLSTQYFFPWYNNKAMNSELRFAVP